MGLHQKESFKYLEKPNKEGVPVYQSFGFKKLKVISRQETRSKFRSEEGPRATPMREILLNPDATDEQKYEVWRRDMPSALSDDQVMDLMTKASTRLTAPKAAKLKESRIIDPKALINAFYVSPRGDRHRVAEKIPYYLLDKLVPLLTKKYAITMKDIEVRPADHTQYTRSSQPDLAEGSEEALAYATQAHAGQTRSGGDPYITHPMRVADHIRKYKQSHNLDALISAAYLHDTIEDTSTTQEALHDLFGGLVASLVQELTSDPAQIKKMGKKHYLAHKMAAMSSYALVIKLADRLDNVKDITTAKTPEWRHKYAQETNHILDYIEKTRALSGTHRKLIELIRAKLAEIDNPQQGLAEDLSIAKPGQLVTIIRAPRILDLLPGESFEVRTSDPEGVTLKHSMGTKFDSVKFPHGTYKILNAQGLKEGSTDTIYPNAEVIKSKNGKPLGEIYQDNDGWGCFYYKADRGYDMIDSREDAMQALKDLHSETARHRPDYTVKGVAEASFDKEAFRRQMRDLEAREELRKTDPVSAKALDLRDALPQATKKKPEDDSMSINDPRHPNASYTQGNQQEVEEAGITRRGILKGLAGAGALGAAGKASAIAGAFPTPSAQQAMYKAAADSNRAMAAQEVERQRRENAARASKLAADTKDVERLNKVNYHGKNSPKPTNAEWDGDSNFLDLDGTKYNKAMRMPITGDEPSDMELITTKEGRQVYIWTRRSLKGTHGRYFYPAEKPNTINEFAPGNGDDGDNYAEYVVYQCDPNDQFEFIGGPLYQTDSMGMAHKYAYEHYLRYRPKAFVVYQPHKEASRGNYGVKGESDSEDELTESSPVERKITRVQSMIQDFYNRAKATKNDIKKNHYLQMADQLQSELDRLINDANEMERDGNMVAQHDSEASDTWNRGGLEEDYLDE